MYGQIEEVIKRSGSCKMSLGSVYLFFLNLAYSRHNCVIFPFCLVIAVSSPSSVCFCPYLWGSHIQYFNRAKPTKLFLLARFSVSLVLTVTSPSWSRAKGGNVIQGDKYEESLWVGKFKYSLPGQRATQIQREQRPT